MCIRDRNLFFNDLEKLIKRDGSIDLIVVTGDFVDRGGWVDNISHVEEFLSAVLEHVSAGGGSPRMVAVPGNHDIVQQQDIIMLNRKGLTEWHEGESEELRSEFWSRDDVGNRPHVKDAFAEFYSWWNEFSKPFRPSSYTEGLLPGDFSATIEKSGKKLGIVGLNSAFLQVSPDAASADLDVTQLMHATPGDHPGWIDQHSFCLLASHHPPECIHKMRLPHFDSEVAQPGWFIAHLCGDLHEGDERMVSQGGAKPRRVWRSPSLFGIQGESDRIHGYSVGEAIVIGETVSVRQMPRIAVKEPQWRFMPDSSYVTDESEATLWDPPLQVAVVESEPESAGIQNGESVGGGETEGQESRLVFLHAYPLSKHFSGRQEVLGRLRVIASEGADSTTGSQASVVVLHAIGGTGKTCLLRQLAEDLTGSQSYDAILWYSFYEARSGDESVFFQDLLEEIAPEILSESDVANAQGIQRAKRLARHLTKALHNQKILLLLDGIEVIQNDNEADSKYGHILSTHKDINELLKSVCSQTRSRAIVTSRIPLKSFGDFVGYIEMPLSHFSPEEGADLLGSIGVDGSAEELRDCSEMLAGHGSVSYTHLTLPTSDLV